MDKLLAIGLLVISIVLLVAHFLTLSKRTKMAEYFYGITDKGKRREKNEDTFFAGEIINKKFVVACVIDGVGGYNGGDICRRNRPFCYHETFGNTFGKCH